jgi:integrase
VNLQLTDTQVRNAKPRNRDYRLIDGHGLHLFVKASGVKLWRARYEFGGREKLISFGAYPKVTLSAAREAHERARKMLAKGIDPMAQRKESEEQEKRVRTEAQVAAAAHPFRELANDWFEWWSPSHNERYSKFVRSRMDADILPAIGECEVDGITPQQICELVLAIEARGAQDVARRALQTVSQVFRWGIPRGRAQQNPAAAYKPTDILKPMRRENFARIEISELPELLKKIHYYDGSPVTRLALQLMTMTFLRTGEMIGGEWPEVNWKEARWDVPAVRMKGGKRPHIVPLPRQAIAVLRDLWNYRQGEGEYIFPGERANGFMSNNTILKALERMGYKGKMTGHGFRGVAATFLREKGYKKDHIELQLAHLTGSDVQRAYDYAKFLPARQKMLQDWADHLDEMLARELSRPDGRSGSGM